MENANELFLNHYEIIQTNRNIVQEEIKYS